MLTTLDTATTITDRRRLLGALIVVDDADHLAPDQLHRLAHHASTRNVKLCLVTTGARDQQLTPPSPGT